MSETTPTKSNGNTKAKIHQLKTNKEWVTYLELMWISVRKNDGLPPYTKNDFLEPGHLNYVVEENDKIKLAVYAKQSPKDAQTLAIHRWTGTQKEVPLLLQVVDVIEKEAHKVPYQKISLLVANTEEEKAFTQAGFRNEGYHPNSTEASPLIWMEKNL